MKEIKDTNRIWLNNVDESIPLIQVNHHQVKLLHATSYSKHLPLKSVPKCHQHPVFHLILTGNEGNFYVNKKLITYKKNELFLVSPHTEHVFSSADKTVIYDELTFLVEPEKGLTASWSFTEFFCQWFNIDNTFPEMISLTDTEANFFQNKIQKIVAIGFENHSFAYLEQLQITAEILFRICRIVLLQGLKDPCPMERIYNYILSHYNEPLTLDELASVVNLSGNYISRQFKKTYGHSPIFFQQKVRLDAAKRMLQSTHYPIKYISHTVGFSNVHFFCKIFLRSEGLSARKYREKMSLK